jgi:hypothetical protein
MLGKVCRKLKIPVPGGGFWAKKKFGNIGKRPVLPPVKDLPVLYRYKTAASSHEQEAPTAHPSHAYQ